MTFIYPPSLKYSVLTQRNPAVNPTLIDRYRALYAGGECFDRLLERPNTNLFGPNPSEAPDMTSARKRELFYINYVGPIHDYFAAMLFGVRPQVRAAKTGESIVPDAFYAEFGADATGQGESMPAFMRARFIDAIVAGASWIRAQLPTPSIEPVNLAQSQDGGLLRAVVSPVAAESVLDWGVNASGALTWAIIHSREQPRTDPTTSRSLIVETFTVLDETSETTYQTTYPPENPPTDQTDIPLIADLTRPHRFPRVPLICIAPGPNLWLMHRLASTQVELFKIDNAFNWAMRRFCFPVLQFKSENKDSPPNTSSGFCVIVGTDEGFSYVSPEAAPFEVMLARRDSMKDELYRVSQQMAMGVNNNAAAIGRSGESKQTDAESTQVVLQAYADLVIASIEDLYELISDGRGEEEVHFSVSGMDSYDLTDLKTFVDTALNVQKLQIPSETFRKELSVKLVKHVMPDLSAEAENSIRSEIEASKPVAIPSESAPGQDAAKDDSNESGQAPDSK